MSGKAQYFTFRKLLREAIGPVRTQAQFAEISGLSAPHLSRMLRQEAISQPMLYTLERIANASEGRVSLLQLQQACGYVMDDLQHTESSESCQRQQSIIASDIIKGVVQFAGGATVHKSLNDFFGTVRIIYCREPITVEFQDDRRFTGTGRMCAERWVNATVRWETEDARCQLAIALFYTRTENGGCIVQDAAFDLPTLLESGHKLAGTYLLKVSGIDNVNLSDYSRVILTNWKSERAKNEVVAERLLNVIFRDCDDDDDRDAKAAEILDRLKKMQDSDGLLAKKQQKSLEKTPNSCKTPLKNLQKQKETTQPKLSGLLAFSAQTWR